MEAMDASSMSKQEKLAWLGLVLTLLGCVYLVAHLFLSEYLKIEGPGVDTARHGSRALILFLVGYVVIKRNKDSIFVDERDRQIKAKRLQAGYTSLALMLLFVATVLGLEEYTNFIDSLTTAWMESFVMLMLLASFSISFAVSVFYYWRDRQ